MRKEESGSERGKENKKKSEENKTSSWKDERIVLWLIWSENENIMCMYVRVYIVERGQCRLIWKEKWNKIGIYFLHRREFRKKENEVVELHIHPIICFCDLIQGWKRNRPLADPVRSQFSKILINSNSDVASFSIISKGTFSYIILANIKFNKEVKQEEFKNCAD